MFDASRLPRNALLAYRLATSLLAMRARDIL